MALGSNAVHLSNRRFLLPLLFNVLTPFFHFQDQLTLFNRPRTLIWKISSKIYLLTSSNNLLTHKEIHIIHSIQTHDNPWYNLFLNNLKEEWLMKEDSISTTWRALLCIWIQTRIAASPPMNVLQTSTEDSLREAQSQRLLVRYSLESLVISVWILKL